VPAQQVPQVTFFYRVTCYQASVPPQYNIKKKQIQMYQPSILLIR